MSSPKRGQRIRSLSDKAPVRPLEAVLQELGIRDWDLLLVGDGSGSMPEEPFGWACCLIEKSSGGRQIFYGGLSSGTINLAELLPYVHALDWYERHIVDGRPSPRGYRSVHVVSDSNTVVTWINQVNQGKLPKKLRPIMCMLAGFRDLGYSLNAHWIQRQTLLLNNAMDLLAVKSRLGITEGMKKAGQCLTGVDINMLERFDP